MVGLGVSDGDHIDLKLPCGRKSCLFDNLADRLVLEGYRHWLAGYETGSIEPWELAWALFSAELGPRNARDVFSAISSWARECHRYATEPQQTFPFNCRRVCRHECMALASVSAIQYDDDQTAEFCLSRLVAKDGTATTRRAASDLAETLTAHGHSMIPVPFPVIASIAVGGDFEPQSNQLH